jgi:putative transposase
MEEKLRFIFEHELRERTMTELCERYEITRQTGYVWLRRYREAGIAGLAEYSRAAHRHRNQMPEEIEQRVLGLRQAHMRWGPRKLKRILERDEPGRSWPAASTIGALLQREGLVVPRKKRLRTAPYSEPLAHADGPNRVWCADFKGWFRTSDGARIDPLTISDAHSRYLLRCQAMEKTDTARVQALFEAAFREYGLPEAIRTDNGAPFATHALAGLSRLAVWWIKLGIVPERIDAGRPSQNGRHERFHRTLNAATAQPPAATIRAQQRRFDAFRDEYNAERPHEALEQQPPLSRYTPSPRAYPRRLEEPSYAEADQVRRVRHTGEIRWSSGTIYLSHLLVGEPVGIYEAADGWLVRYGPVELGRLDPANSRLSERKPRRSGSWHRRGHRTDQ